MTENIKLLQGDCLELMKDIPNDSVNMVLTDPPYLIDYKTNYRKNKEHDFCTAIKNDSGKQAEHDINEYFKECHRILKDNSAMYMFCSPKMIDKFIKFSLDNGFKIKNQIIWVKNNWTAGDLKAQFGQQYEIILLLNKGRKLFNGKRLTDVWFFDRVSGKLQVHQNQKPVDLLEQCILKHSDEGDIIFDGYMGSGSTGVACMNTNRRFIGIELEEKYFKVAESRIANQLKDFQ